MAIEMIDAATAKAAMERIAIGDTVTGSANGVTYSRTVVDKTPYSVILQGLTNRLTVPIATTDIYKEEYEMRMPTTAGDPTKPAPRGRPKKPTSAAPVEQPGQGQAQVNTYLPPGYTPPIPTMPQGGYTFASNGSAPGEGNEPFRTENIPTEQRSAMLAAAQAEQAAKAQRIEVGMQPVQPQQMTIQQAEGSANWAEESLEEAFETLREHLSTIIEGVKNEAIEAAAQEEQPSTEAATAHYTCWDCVYVNKTMGNCSKFNGIVPPMHVIVDCEKQCNEFMAMDGDIPF